MKWLLCCWDYYIIIEVLYFVNLIIYVMVNKFSVGTIPIYLKRVSCVPFGEIL